VKHTKHLNKQTVTQDKTTEITTTVLCSVTKMYFEESHHLTSKTLSMQSTCGACLTNIMSKH